MRLSTDQSDVFSLEGDPGCPSGDADESLEELAVFPRLRLIVFVVHVMEFLRIALSNDYRAVLPRNHTPKIRQIVSNDVFQLVYDGLPQFSCGFLSALHQIIPNLTKDFYQSVYAKGV